MKIASGQPSRYFFIPQVLVYDKKRQSYFNLCVLTWGVPWWGVHLVAPLTERTPWAPSVRPPTWRPLIPGSR